MRGLDPRIHPSSESFLKLMDGRVKPGHDGLGIVRETPDRSFAKNRRSKYFPIQVYVHVLAARIASEVENICPSGKIEGAGKAGRLMHPQPRMQK
ncbi:MAG TPA: hypothetical protein VK834_02615 [Bradyrhizobium sp.]|jgi:hypothetical protein|nr:hypothetical protein [Bradyrhizobium sp.]